MLENFEKIIIENLRKEDAPPEITLPKELVEGMAQSWGKSFPQGKSQEQGGILVRKKDGSYQWKAGQPGLSAVFVPNHNDVNKDDTLIAVGHTHPYDKNEGSHTNVSFSDIDLAFMVYEKHPLEIVQSGEALFVVARTENFNKKVASLDTTGKKILFYEIKITYRNVLKTSPGKWRENIDTATKTTCEKYDLVYYKGKHNQLTKV
ncbi:MAG: hypothetical protein ACPGWR_06975 [Ardenticatenaceae bacterium]